MATTRGFAQAQGDILKTQRGFAQAQATIIGSVVSQVPAEVVVKSIPQVRASQTVIEVLYKPSVLRRSHAQAQALISAALTLVYAQANADIKATGRSFAQAQALINAGYVSQVPVEIVTKDIPKSTSSQVVLEVVVRYPPRAFAQAQARIISTVSASAQAQARIVKSAGYAQAQARIFGKAWKFAQAQASIKIISRGFAQAAAAIKHGGSGQAQALIRKNIWKFAQAQAGIKTTCYYSAQAQAYIVNRRASAQAQAQITNTKPTGQAQAMIRKPTGSGQAQAKIMIFGQSYANAQAFIGKRAGYGQARAYIKVTGNRKFAQAMAFIHRNISYAQAMAMIKHGGSAQAQARIVRSGSQVYAQAAAKIARPIGFAQAAAYITGGRYLVKYNEYVLPGYAQQEVLESDMNIQGHYAYEDMSLSEYVGLKNKIVSLRMKVWEQDYYTSKEQIKLAATIIRTRRAGFSKLYVQRSDRYYEALAKKISFEASAEQSGKLIDYSIEFETKPWLISDREYTISGTGTITTDQVSRTIYDGGWSPVTLTLTGTNITVSGYSSTEQFTGFIGASGVSSGLIVHTDTEGYGTLYVGPGKTTFVVTGATSCIISYHDRWYL